MDGQSFGKDREVGAGRYEEVLAGGPDLTERKQLLAKDAECFIALPGGPGTWEELWEIVCQRQLGLPPPDDESAAGIAPARRGRGPVCLVNVDGFYDGFIATAERAVADGLLHWKGADAVAGPRATAAAGDDAPHLLMHRHTAAAALTCCVKAVGGHCSVSASLSHCVHDIGWGAGGACMCAQVALERCLLERAGGGDQAVAGLATHANSPTTVSAALPPPPPPPPAVGGISWTPLRAGLVGGGIGAALGCAVNSGHACTRLIDVRATGPGW
eukprot:COSAG01_NODE_1022_length_12069_cov_142.565581_2_plen_272_part_00